MKKIVLLLFLSLPLIAANQYKQPAPAIFYQTITLPKLGTSGIVTNTSGGLLGTTVLVPVANGGTNSGNALANNRIMISSGGTVGEAGALTASSPMRTNLLGLPTTGLTSLTSEISGILPIANGGTNSGNALANNRIMVSSGGTIGETGALTANQVMITNSSGLPTVETALSTVRGGTGSTNFLFNNRVLVSSHGTVVEQAGIFQNSPVRSDSNGLLTTGSTSLTAEVTGVLPLANGGTNSAASPLFNNRIIVSKSGSLAETNPLTSSQVVIADNNGLPISLAIGSANSVLTSVNGSPSWQANSALSNPMNALGDMIVGAAGGSSSRLPVGQGYSILTVGSGSSTANLTPQWGLRVITAHFGGGTPFLASSQCTADPCTIWSQTGGRIQSINRTGTGLYTINFMSNTFLTTPVCIGWNYSTSGASYPYWSGGGATPGQNPNSYSFQTLAATVNDDVSGEFMCIGF